MLDNRIINCYGKLLAAVFLFLAALCDMAPAKTSCSFLNESNRREIRFIEYLVEQHFWRDVVFAAEAFAESTEEKGQSSSSLQDTLNFWVGWAAYHLQDFPLAIERLNRVRTGHPDYWKAQFHAHYLGIHQAVLSREYDELLSVEEKIRSMHCKIPLHCELRSFQLAGIELLRRDFQAFDLHSKSFSGKYFAMADQQTRFSNYALELQKAGKKSPFAAAMMSAIIPGSGKVYAGKRGSGISSFLQVAVIGSLFAESLHRAGSGNARTWVAGSVFGIFYLGNIRGSAAAVRIARNEIYEEMDQHILLDLHIPLRNLFR